MTESHHFGGAERNTRLGPLLLAVLSLVLAIVAMWVVILASGATWAGSTAVPECNTSLGWPAAFAMGCLSFSAALAIWAAMRHGDSK